MNIFADILGSTILFAVPLLLVALGGMFSEHGGVINIALEGIMIFGGLCSCLFLKFATGFGLPAGQLTMFLAILVAGLSGMIYSLALAFAAINLKANQTIGGTALNIIAPAFSVILAWAIQGQGNTDIQFPTWIRMATLSADPSFFEVVFLKNLYLTTPIAIVLFIISYILMYKTKFGLRLRACGEHPQAADSVGINVSKMRYAGTMISGFLAGIGGLAFTISAGSGFASTVAGYGFLGLAVMIFGNWKPLSILGASLFFSLFKVIGAYASAIPFLPDLSGVKNSTYIYQMIPYIVTMILLIFTSKRSKAPKAEGIPYDKGMR